MGWDSIQNYLSNIVFGILLFGMIIYWVSLLFLPGTTGFSKIGRIGSIIANLLLFFYTLFTLDYFWLFSLK